MENEIINGIEEVIVENNEVVEACTKKGNGVYMLIGAGLVAAGVGAYKLGCKAWDIYKAKKQAKANIIDDITEDVIEDIVE